MSPNAPISRIGIIGLISLIGMACQAHAALTTNSILCEVTVNLDTPSATITWESLQNGAQIIIQRRDLGVVGVPGNTRFVTLATIDYTTPNPIRTYTDNTIEKGKAYEYRVGRPGITYNATYYSEGSSYFVVTTEPPLEESRGTVLLVVEAGLLPAMEQEIRILESDIVGDGWSVKRLPFAAHTAGGKDIDLKAAIQAACTADPSINALYIFGRLPVPYSGMAAPDGHIDLHCLETDLFYADLDGNWTDTTCNTKGTVSDQAQNIPGDGIWDQDYIPSAVELMPGRVDFYRMHIHRKSEREYLRDYIQKSHAWKHAMRPVPYKAINGWPEYLVAEKSWIYTMFGAANYSEDKITPFLRTNERLIAHDVVSYNGANVYAYGAVDNRGIFMQNFASGKQRWYRENGMQRALLAQPDWGFTCTWGSRPGWFYHHLAAGKPVGYSALRTINTQICGNEYYPNGEYGTMFSGAVTNNLMGDPTLRLVPVLPATSLSASGSGSTASLAWSAPSDATRIGWHIYRSSERTGPFVRLTAEMLDPAARNFSDTSRPDSDVYYQVRSIMLTRVPTGSYQNQSQGIFALLRTDGTQNQPPVATQPPLVTAPSGAPVRLSLTGSDAEGDSLTPIMLRNPQHGQIRWHNGTAFYISGIKIKPAANETDGEYYGDDSFTFCLFDGVNFSAPVTGQIRVIPREESNLLLGWQFKEVPDAPTGDPASTLNHSLLKPSSIVLGSGYIKYSNADYNSDCIVGRTPIRPTNISATEYFSWKCAGRETVRQSLERLTFFTFTGLYPTESVGPNYNIELRASVDNFSTYTTIPLDSGGVIPAMGGASNHGMISIADLRSFPQFQNTESEIEFRLYFWDLGTDCLGIGRSADLAAQNAFDIAIYGNVEIDAPIANASPDRKASAGDYSLTLDGSLSTGGCATYLWKQISGPTVAITDADKLRASVSAATPGTYVFELLIINPVGSSSDRMTLSISGGEGAPIVDCEQKTLSSVIGHLVSMNATAIDPQSNTLNFSWVQISGPDSITLSAANTLSPSFMASTPGVYTFRFTAANGSLYSSLLVTVTVTAPSPIIYEPFNYTESGNLSTTAPWSDVSAGANNAQLVSGLTRSPYVTAGKAAATWGSLRYTYRSVPNTKSFKTMGTVYMSGFFRAALPVSITSGTQPNVAINFTTAAPAQANGLLLGITNAKVDGSTTYDTVLHAFASTSAQLNTSLNSAANIINMVAEPTALAQNTTYFLLAKYEITDATNNKGRVSLLVVPPGATIPQRESEVTWTAIKNNTEIIPSSLSFSYLFVGQGISPVVTSGVSNVADEIRIGENYTSILPSTQIVPFSPPSQYNVWAAAIDWKCHSNKPEDTVGTLGISNLTAYALAINPFNTDSQKLPLAGLEIETSSGLVAATPSTPLSLTLTYRENLLATDLDYWLEASDKLDTWQTVNFDGIRSKKEIADPDADGNGEARIMRATLLLDPSDTTKFLRLKIQKK